jgi:hypothetical protein
VCRVVGGIHGGDHSSHRCRVLFSNASGLGFLAERDTAHVMQKNLS